MTQEEKTRLIHEEFLKVRAVMAESHEHLLSLFSRQKITDEDLNKMSTVMVYLFRHLYEKFFEDSQSISEEVFHMVKSMLDVEALRRASEKARVEGRKEGQLEAKVEDLMKILQVKQFDRDEIIVKVAKETDAGRISDWVVAAATISEYADFRLVVAGAE